MTLRVSLTSVAPPVAPLSADPAAARSCRRRSTSHGLRGDSSERPVELDQVAFGIAHVNSAHPPKLVVDGRRFELDTKALETTRLVINVLDGDAQQRMVVRGPLRIGRPSD